MCYDAPMKNGQSSAANLAHLIADVAHTAKGQTRADKATPYIRHPERVAQLVDEWLRAGVDAGLSVEREVALDAAYLHDVLEDTRVTRDDLLRYGVSARAVEVVIRLTKTNRADEPEDAAYYRGVAADDTARFVKAADRCANLEDALTEVRAGRTPRRWARYVERTYSDVVPMYASLPPLRQELVRRLRALERAQEAPAPQE
jgi:(p)ppGpp synthase/HD superfamily hydrolase